MKHILIVVPASIKKCFKKKLKMTEPAYELHKLNSFTHYFFSLFSQRTPSSNVWNDCFGAQGHGFDFTDGQRDFSLVSSLWCKSAINYQIAQSNW